MAGCEIPTIRIRGGWPEDVEYVIKSWLRDYKRTLPRNTPGRTYYPAQQQVIGVLASTSTIKVACDANDMNMIYGFAVGQAHPELKTLVVHYVYIRDTWRRLGIAKALIKELGYQDGWEIVATHWTNYLERLATMGPQRVKYPFLVYHQYLLYSLFRNSPLPTNPNETKNSIPTSAGL